MVYIDKSKKKGIVYKTHNEYTIPLKKNDFVEVKLQNSITPDGVETDFFVNMIRGFYVDDENGEKGNRLKKVYRYNNSISFPYNKNIISAICAKLRKL